MTTHQLLIHSHKGEDGANVLVQAGAGDVVRRKGYRRHWLIVGNEGQMVAVIARNGDTRTLTVHADELTMIRKARK